MEENKETSDFKPKVDWSVQEASDFANTLANHGWTREANADSASSCIYSLCRLLKEHGNAAALRDALKSYVEYSELVCRMGIFTRDRLVEITTKAKAALAETPRNCDLYDSKESARKAHEEYRSKYIFAASNKFDFPMEFDDWLFAPATERKGDSDGSE